MRRYYFTIGLAIAAWMIAYSPWSGSVRAQNYLLNTNANITANTPPNPRGTTYFNVNFPLNFVAGTAYTMQAATQVTPAYSVDTYFYLLSPSGATLTSNDDWGQQPNPYGSQIVYTPTVAGTYTLVVTTFSSGASYSNVPVTVTYTGTPQTGGPTPGGVPNVQLTPIDGVNLRTYAATTRPVSRLTQRLLVLGLSATHGG